MNHLSRIAVLGTDTMIGKRLSQVLFEQGYTALHTLTTQELLATGAKITEWFSNARPEFLFFAAGRSGGIGANLKHPAEFIHANLLLQTACIDAAYRSGIARLIFFGSSCMYPKSASQPIREEALGTGPLEPTSESYAISRIAGMSMCRAYNVQYRTSYSTLIPATIYGPGDHFDEENSHVLASLIRRFHSAKNEAQTAVTLRGSGTPLREFIYVDDLCDAALTLMNSGADVSGDVFNAGSGEEIAIRDLAAAICTVTEYRGSIQWDASQKDGVTRKMLDSSGLKNLGWMPRVRLHTGIPRTYEWFLQNLERSH